MLTKFIALFLILVGEALTIYAELYCGKLFSAHSRSCWWAWSSTVGLITVGAWGLMAGYGIGMNVFRDPWIVPVFSLTAILFIEPVLVFLLYNAIPTWRAVGGLVLGALGLLLVLGGE